MPPFVVCVTNWVRRDRPLKRELNLECERIAPAFKPPAFAQCSGPGPTVFFVYVNVGCKTPGQPPPVDERNRHGRPVDCLRGVNVGDWLDTKIDRFIPNPYLNVTVRLLLMPLWIVDFFIEWGRDLCCPRLKE